MYQWAIENNTNLFDLNLSFLLQNPKITGHLFGFSTKEQIDNTLKVLQNPLNESLLTTFKDKFNIL